MVSSSVGYISYEQPAGSETTFAIPLVVDVKQLSEIVVTGYGLQQERRNITGAIATVNSTQYKDPSIIGLDQALQGRAAGVQVTQGSGTPGSGISVWVRGPLPLVPATNHCMWLIAYRLLRATPRSLVLATS